MGTIYHFHFSQLQFTTLKFYSHISEYIRLNPEILKTEPGLIFSNIPI